MLRHFHWPFLRFSTMMPFFKDRFFFTFFPKLVVAVWWFAYRVKTKPEKEISADSNKTRVS